jgi:GNAT superfamily N-acetyltransferase
MAEIEVHRVSDGAGAARCEEMYVEYVAWIFDQFKTVHGLDFPAEGQAVVHDEFRAEYPKLFGARGLMVLATVDQTPAAVAALKPLSVDGSELKRMFVRPEFRGLGVARRLIEYVIDEARALGYRTVQLNTVDFMAGAHRLYRSAGFVDCTPYPGENRPPRGGRPRALHGARPQRRLAGGAPKKRKGNCGGKFSPRRRYRRSVLSNWPCERRSSAHCRVLGARPSSRGCRRR